MTGIERGAVRTVAKLSPWLAPLPSAYFVARSAIEHLGVPLVMAVVMAAIIETLGLATVHTTLWLYEWNATKRKADPASPLWLAVALGAVYVLATWGLVVFLEVWPWLATYAPAIFPALAVVGSLNLAIVSRQEGKEAAIAKERAATREARRASRAASPSKPKAIVAQRETKASQIIALYEQDRNLPRVKIAEMVGCHPGTVTKALAGRNGHKE